MKTTIKHSVECLAYVVHEQHIITLVFLCVTKIKCFSAKPIRQAGMLVYPLITQHSGQRQVDLREFEASQNHNQNDMVKLCLKQSHTRNKAQNV